MWVSSLTWRWREFGLVLKFKRGYTIYFRRRPKKVLALNKNNTRQLWSVCVCLSGSKHFQICKTARTFFKHFWRTSVFLWGHWYFWWYLPWVSNQGGFSHLCASLPACNGFLRFTSGCNTCWPFCGQHGSQAISTHVLCTNICGLEFRFIYFI